MKNSHSVQQKPQRLGCVQLSAPSRSQLASDIMFITTVIKNVRTKLRFSEGSKNTPWLAINPYWNINVLPISLNVNWFMCQLSEWESDNQSTNLSLQLYQIQVKKKKKISSNPDLIPAERLRLVNPQEKFILLCCQQASPGETFSVLGNGRQTKTVHLKQNVSCVF